MNDIDIMYLIDQLKDTIELLLGRIESLENEVSGLQDRWRTDIEYFHS